MQVERGNASMFEGLTLRQQQTDLAEEVIAYSNGQAPTGTHDPCCRFPRMPLS